VRVVWCHEIRGTPCCTSCHEDWSIPGGGYNNWSEEVWSGVELRQCCAADIDGEEFVQWLEEHPEVSE
jgi:hypothetical protein